MSGVVSKWILCGFLVLALAGCRQPWGSGGQQPPPVAAGTGTLVLSLNPTDVLVARTITPPQDMELGHYDIYGTGPGDPFTYLGYEEDTLVQASLEPGLWTIVVEAYSRGGVLIGEGVQEIMIEAGVAATTVILVSPADGTGELEILISWPANVLTSPQLMADLSDVVGGSWDMVFDLTSTSAHYHWDAVPRGYYAVSLHLKDEAEPVWGTLEAARIMAGVKSYRHYQLVEDVNRGGVVIVPDLQDPIDIAIEGVIDPLSAGKSMTVSADTTGVEVDSYQWYLNGTPVGTDTDTLTVGDLPAGHHWLDVLVTRGPVMSSANAEFAVVGDTEILDLNGYWHTFFTEEGETYYEGLTYIHQDGSAVEIEGMTGTLVGSSLFVEAWYEDDGELLLQTFAATASQDEIVGYVTDDDLTFDVRLTRATPLYGRLDMEGDYQGTPISLHTDEAIAFAQGTRVNYGLHFDLNVDGVFWGFNTIFNSKEVGSYTVFEEAGEDEPGEAEAMLWVDGWEYRAWGGTVTLTEVDSAGVAGTYDLSFPGGDSLSGEFDITYDQCGSVSLSGIWNGMPVEAGTTCSWGELRETWYWESQVSYEDADLAAGLWFSTHEPEPTGVFEINMQAGISLFWWPSSGPVADWNDVRADSGMLTITRRDGTGIAGTMAMSFEGGGTITGSFDVPFTPEPEP